MGSLIFFFLLYLILALVNLAHPIRVAFLLIFLSIIISLFSLKLLCSWFFYLIVLVFLGGVIILIIYIKTLSANEKFRTMLIKTSDCVIVAIVSFFLLFIIKIKSRFSIVNINNTAIGISYESSNFSSLIFLMSYLLITLVCVVKLVKFESGPLIKRL